MSGPGVGDPGPDFVLPGTGGVDYHLADYLGAPVLLVFYPLDNSPVCTLQLRSYSDGLSTFGDAGAQVLGLSPQSVASHEAFAQSLDLKFPLLADTNKAVGESYGILGPLGFYRRSVFVLDGAGIVRYVRRSLTNLAFVELGDLVEAVRASG